VDENSGDQGGVAQGIFEFWWRGETLYARNNGVGDSHLFAWSNWPEEAAVEGAAKPRRQVLVWRANYPTAASVSTRCTARLLLCRWPCPATM